MPRHQGSPSPHPGPSAEHAPPHKRSGGARAEQLQPPALVTTRDKSGIGCPKPVLGYRFRLASGKLVPIPCGRSSCQVCARRSAMITAAMVGLDARQEQPHVVSTFTTRDPIGPARLREATAQILRLVRAELDDVRYCHFLEFTTGKSSSSGGRRRPHLHTLWKGVDRDDAPVIAGCAGHVLERVSGSWRHDVEEIRSPAGATMYVARHHLKESQAPPASWAGTRRVRASRGYWSRPAAELRTSATAIVREKRVRRRLETAIAAAEEQLGADLGDVLQEQIAEALSQPPAVVVRVSNTWDDPLGRETAS